MCFSGQVEGSILACLDCGCLWSHERRYSDGIFGVRAFGPWVTNHGFPELCAGENSEGSFEPRHEPRHEIGSVPPRRLRVYLGGDVSTPHEEMGQRDGKGRNPMKGTVPRDLLLGRRGPIPSGTFRRLWLTLRTTPLGDRATGGFSHRFSQLIPGELLF